MFCKHCQEARKKGPFSGTTGCTNYRTSTLTWKCAPIGSFSTVNIEKHFQISSNWFQQPSQFQLQAQTVRGGLAPKTE